MTVLSSCPSWCVNHRYPVPESPGDCGAHYGPPAAIELGNDHGDRMPSIVWVQPSAHDRDGQRHTLIELTDPHGVSAELNITDARRAALILIQGADMQLAPSEVGCPHWCQGHALPAPFTLEHQGPTLEVGQPAPAAWGIAIAVRVTAVDDLGGSRTRMDLIVQGIATDITGSEACKIAAHLLNNVDLANLG